MEGKNYWNGLGNLCDDGALRYTKSGEPVYSFRIACSESFFDKKSNERKERTEYVNCVLWGKRGESLSKILHKGSRVDITGRLQTRSWDKDGEKRYATEINVQNVILLDAKSSGHGQQDAGNDRGYTPPQDGGGGYDEDPSIPF